MNLKDKTIKSIFWFSIEKFGTQFIQLVLNLILARILLPSDYGTIGMVLVFLSISAAIVESGFSQALIRKIDVSDTDYNTVFIFNITSAVLLYMILFFISPVIADFYKLPELDLLTKVISLNLIFISLSLIQSTILTKRIDFKLQTKIALVSIAISSACSVFMAISGFGYWALVYQMLIMNAIRTVLLWLYVKWKPENKFTYKSFTELFNFGSKLFLANIIETGYQNLYSLIIGRMFSAQILGLYSQAKKIEETPTSSLSQIIQKVTYPAYASIQNDDIRLKRGYKQSIALIMYVNAPLMLCLFAVSDSFIEIVLSHKWIDASVYLKLLCLMGIIYPLHPMNLNILKVKGRSDLFFKLQVVKTIISLIFIFLGLIWGIFGLITGQILSVYIAYYLNAFYSGRLIDYGIKEQLHDIAPYICISFLVFVPVYYFGVVISNNYILFTLQLIVGLSSYIFITKLFKFDGYKDLKSIIMTYLAR